MSTTSSRGMSAPIMAQKRGMRNARSMGSDTSGHSSTMPASLVLAALTVPPATSTMSAAAAAERSSMPWSSTPRS